MARVADTTTAPEAIPCASPVTGEPLGDVIRCPPEHARAAAEEAAQVQPLWALLRLEDRARYMRRAAQAVIDESEALIELIAREQGRPPAEVALMEVLPAIDALDWIGEQGPKILGAQRLGLWRTLYPRKRARVAYEPLGVVAVLAASDAPFAHPAAQVGAALMGGNGVVLAARSGGRLAAERLAGVLARAGLPEGLFRVVQGDLETAVALVDSPAAKILFTGDRADGDEVAAACARASKGSVLETAGKDCAIVLADANVRRAGAGIAWGAFCFAGQARGSIERVFVAPEVAERLARGIAEAAARLVVGDPLAPGVQVGPLASEERLRHVEELVADAVDRGAQLHGGGRVEQADLNGSFYAPAVLEGVTDEMRIATEPVGGPVVALTTVGSTAEAIGRVNATEGGLGASVWSADRHHAGRIARELHVGMVWCNDHFVGPAAPALPWGSVRRPGGGRAHGAQGLRACVEPKVLTWDPPRWRPSWWFPYDETVAAAARAVALLRSARDSDRERGLRRGALPLLRTILRTVRGLRED